MTRKNAGYFISAIFIIAILFILVIIYASAAENNQLAVTLSFGAMVASILAVALALVSIGHSIKDADICIFLGDKNVSNAGTIQEIRLKNRGNAMGNIASAFVEIEVNASSPVSFAGATGLNFAQTGNMARKQYRFDAPTNPMPLYPAEYIWTLIGFIQVPPQPVNQVKFNVQIVGTQGRTRKEFEIKI